MKLVRYQMQENQSPRIGVWTPIGILDVALCAQVFSMQHGDKPLEFPQKMEVFFQGGAKLLQYVDKVVQWALTASTAKTLLFNPSQARFLPPIQKPGKMLGIGMNYRAHCLEQKKEIPKHPIVFVKCPNALNSHDQPVVLPRATKQLDFEAELGVVIGKKGRHIPEEEALQYVGGYLNVNDITARDIQAREPQWTRAKSCDTFAPIGPLLVTPDEIENPQNLRVVGRLNGEVTQDASTADMIFTVAKLIAFISEVMTLEPGDIIATGTPSGVGVCRTPQVFLKDGDVVEVEVEGLGILRNTIQKEPLPAR